MQLQNKHSTYNYELKENETLKEIDKFAKLSKYSNLKGFTSQINVSINVRDKLYTTQDQERYDWLLEDTDKLSDAQRFDEFAGLTAFTGEFIQISVSIVETPIPLTPEEIKAKKTASTSNKKEKTKKATT